MARISTAELKRVVLAAEKNRLKHMARVDLTHHPRLLSAQRAGDEFLAAFFRKAGFDEGRFAALQRQHRAELQRVVDQQDAEAVRTAPRAMKAVLARVRSQRDALRRLAASKPLFPFPLTTLDKPFLIWATPRSNIISDSRIEPFNSWAKIRIESGASSGSHKLSFYFLWQNPSEFYAVINGSTFMGATGRLRATVSGGLSGIDPTSRFSYVGCSVNLALWSWWVRPPVSTPYASHHLAGVGETASFWDKSEAVSVADGFNLDQTHFLVPPNGVVVFEVTLEVGYSNGHGRALADFETGDFRVTCPLVVVGILTGTPALRST